MSKWVDAKAKVSEVEFLTPTVPMNMQEEAMVMREGRRVRDEKMRRQSSRCRMQEEVMVMKMW